MKYTIQQESHDPSQIPRVCCNCDVSFCPAGYLRNCHVDARKSGWMGFALIDVKQQSGKYRKEFIGLCPGCRQ